MKENVRNTGYRIIKQPNSIFRTPKSIVSTKKDPEFCPQCSGKLEQYHALIPVEKKMKADVPGLWCRKCDKLYVKDGSSIRKLLKDNSLAKGYTLDGEELWNYTNRKRKIKQKNKRKKKMNQIFKARLKKLSEIPSSEVMICVHFEDKSYSDYIIVSNTNDCISNEIIHYSSEMGRELISAAYAEQRESSGTINGKNFRVTQCIYPHPKYRQLSDYIIFTDLIIRPDGGYSSSCKNGQREMVHTLLYSLSTNRYEIIPSTFDKTTGECFVDIGLFRNYVNEYGRPNLSPNFEVREVYGPMDFDELNSESVLKCYGYSVSQAEGLSTGERQELLAEIVDLEILTVKKVVTLLDFFIQTHAAPKYIEARFKWESDKKYIQGYNVNPQRFLIARS